MPQLQYKYWAFISYSHQDEAWARWLHQRLETWRVPRRLVGLAHPDGVIPRRLQPVFRDRDELASSAELGAVINRALAESRYQIVICSPRSAASRWVNEEIRAFKSLGRESRVLALIVDGEPHAVDPAQECFAPSLKWRIHSDGTPGDEAVEPIAADARGGRDGRDGALLKLLAGILDVGYDELVQRERRRRLWDRLRMFAAAAAVVAAVAGAWIAFDRYRTEQALQYRITELYQSGRRELLAHNEARAAVLLNEVYKLGVDTPALRYMLGRAMRVVDAQQLRFQTGSAVLMVKLSPDGSKVFTIGADSHLRIWATDTGAKLADINLGDFAEIDAAYSPGGSWISVESAHEDEPRHRLRTFEADSGALKYQAEQTLRATELVLQPIDGSDRWLSYVNADQRLVRVDLLSNRETSIQGQYTVSAFCRDGRTQLVGRSDGALLRMESGNLRVTHIYTGLSAPVSAIDSSDDCRAVTAGTAEGAFRVWEAANGRTLLIGGNHHGITDLRLNSDGSRLMSLARSGVSVWNSASGGLVYSARFQDPISTLAAISRDGEKLVVLSDSHLAMVDPATGSELYSLDGHVGSVQAFNFGADGRRFASGAVDGSVALWTLPVQTLADLQQGDPLAPGDEPPAPSIAFSRSGNRYFTGGGDGNGAVWDGDTRQHLFGVGGHRARLRSAAFSADGRLLATGGDDAEVRVWNASTGNLLRRLTNVGGGVIRLNFNFESVLAAQTLGGRTRLWDSTTGDLIGEFERDESPAGAFSPDDQVYAYGLHGVVNAWDLANRSLRWRTSLRPDPAIDPGVGVIAYSPDGRSMLATLTSRRAWILDAHDGRVLSELTVPSSSYFNAGEFSPDGRRVVLADSGKLAEVWEPASGRRLVLGGHSAPVRAASFDPAGELILTAGDDGVVRIWDADSGDLLDAFAAHDGSVPRQRALFTSDGRAILTGGTDFHARLWLVPHERRSAMEISNLLNCRVAWKADGMNLLAANPDSGKCFPVKAPKS